MSAFPTLITQEIAEYIVDKFSSEDEFLSRIKAQAIAEEIPEICISPEQGRFMQFMLKSINAKYVLEIGSLFGYSAINMARALPSDGKVVALELDPRFANFIRRISKEAGMESKIEVHNAEAGTFLDSYQPDFQFDFIFADADKVAYRDYLDKTLGMLRRGGIFAADNALAFGEIMNPSPSEDEINIKAIREFNDYFLSRSDFYVTLAPVGDGMIMGIKL